MIVYLSPPFPARLWSSRPVHEGALLEGTLKWDRAKAGRRGNPTVDAAPAAVVCTHRPGRPWVTVRAHYGALPSMAGRGWSERAKAFGIMAQASPRAGSTAPGTKKSPRRDAERRCRVPLFPGNPGNKPRPLPRCAFRRPVTPHFGGETKANLGLTGAARMRKSGCLKFESEIREAHERATLTAVIARLDRATQYSRLPRFTPTAAITGSPHSRG